MDKLQLKHLAPYLPYGLKMTSSVKGRSAYITTIKRRLKKIEELTPELMSVMLFLNRKPILRPLSDLTKDEYYKLSGDIEGQSFGFWYGKCNSINNKREYIYHEGYSSRTFFLERGPGQFPYKMMLFFFKHHFDVFELIDAKLAIDINTL